MGKHLKITEQLRREIDKYESRYRLAKDSGVDEATISRFMSGKGINSDALDKMAATLGLKLTKRGN